MRPAASIEPAEDPFFRRLVSISTGLALAGMLGSLAVFERGSHGKLILRWHWAAIPLVGVGLVLGIQFWRVLWQAQSQNTPAARGRLRRFGILLAVIAVGSFAYPMRYLQPERRAEVFTGLGLAVVVLSAFGWLILKTIQWVNASELKDGETGPEDRS